MHIACRRVSVTGKVPKILVPIREVVMALARVCLYLALLPGCFHVCVELWGDAGECGARVSRSDKITPEI